MALYRAATKRTADGRILSNIRSGRKIFIDVSQIEPHFKANAEARLKELESRHEERAAGQIAIPTLKSRTSEQRQKQIDAAVKRLKEVGF